MAKLQTTSIYWKNWRARKYIVVNRGGTRSSKTYSLCMLAFSWLIDRKQKQGGVWSICRATLPSLKATAYRDFKNIMFSAGYGAIIDHNKTELTFTIGKEGQPGFKMVEFFSLDQEQKIRSRKRDVLHLVESNEISFEIFNQLVIRTQKRIYLDLNPSISGAANWIKEDIEEKRLHELGDVEIIQSTYKDNPHLTTQEIKNIEYLQQTDPELWKVFGLGEWGTVQGVIFPKFTIIDKMPEDLERSYLGLDFGYTDPTACIQVAKHKNRLYLNQRIYGTHYTTNDISEMLEGTKTWIVADSADPGSIEQLRRDGYRIQKAKKGKDSIYSGLMLMKKHELFVTASSVDLIKELRNYKWSDKKADTPVDMFNHAIDAARYVVNTRFRGAPLKRSGMR